MQCHPAPSGKTMTSHIIPAKLGERAGSFSFSSALSRGCVFRGMVGTDFI